MTLRPRWRAFCLGLLSTVATQAIAAQSQLPLRSESAFPTWRLALNALFIAVVCLGVAAVGLYAWRNRIRPQGALPKAADTASVEWARRVSPRTTLLVIRWRGRNYLLAENSGSTRVIDSHADEPPP